MADEQPLEWTTDVLGEAYQRLTLDLPDDDEGPVVATLVRRATDAPSHRAVLYLHGFVDYFFQTHLADFYADRGFDFYALDLRKYGRSLGAHQTPNYVQSIQAYSAEIDEAVRIIREVDGHDVLLLNGHSTGGLIAALWAHHNSGRGLIQGLFLNSPFLELNENWLTRKATRGVEALGRRKPYAPVPSPLSEHYVHSIHSDFRGSWTFDLAWKPAQGFPVRAGWLGAIRRGHRAVAGGLAIDVPILAMSSTASYRGKAWDDRYSRADVVLNANQIARLTPRLGDHVTIVRIEGGIHDLVLSADASRKQLFDELDRWMRAYLPN